MSSVSPFPNPSWAQSTLENMERRCLCSQVFRISLSWGAQAHTIEREYLQAVHRHGYLPKSLRSSFCSRCHTSRHPQFPQTKIQTIWSLTRSRCCSSAVSGYFCLPCVPWLTSFPKGTVRAICMLVQELPLISCGERLGVVKILCIYHVLKVTTFPANPAGHYKEHCL